MNIGQVPIAAVLHHAKELAALGGPAVPDGAADVTDLAVTGGPELLLATRAAAKNGGSVLMSSGGTIGEPKLVFVPHHMAIGRLLKVWRPLDADSVLLNLFSPGRLWGSHYYMQALAERSGCTVVPTGSVGVDEVGRWLKVLREVGVNAVAGTPTALADLAEGLLRAGETLPVRTIIWMAEPWLGTKLKTVREALPEAEFWGNYGSVETFVMATNTPACDMDTLHLMADQMIEPEEKGALLSRGGEGWSVPTVRYRLGDKVAAAECRCGRPDGLRVVGRADDAVNMRTTRIYVGDMLNWLRRQPGVEDAQLVLTRSDLGAGEADAVRIHVTGAPALDELRQDILTEYYSLGVRAELFPGCVVVERVAELARIERTNKVPPAVWV